MVVVLLIVVFAIGFLVGAKQEQKRYQPKDYIPEPEVIEKLQKLAGIIEHDRSNGSKELAEIIDGLTRKKDAAVSMFTSENVTEFLKTNSDKIKKAKDTLDKSIEATKKWNEVRSQYNESQKIQKGGASVTTDKIKKCGCGRSETGFCTGLHKISKTDWQDGVREIPKTK